MPNETNDFISQSIHEGVLLPADKLALVKRTNDIIKQAKTNAIKMIKEAEAESEAIRLESYRAGYEQGLVMSIDSVCRYIDNSARHAHEMEMEIRNNLKNVISSIINEDDFNVKVAEHWVTGLDKQDESSSLNILIPYANRKLKERFALAIKKQYSGNVIFEFHDEPWFVFKYNDRLAEFYPDEFVYTTVDTLTSKHSLTERQVEISSETIRYLHEQLSILYPPPQENESEDLIDE